MTICSICNRKPALEGYHRCRSCAYKFGLNCGSCGTNHPIDDLLICSACAEDMCPSCIGEKHNGQCTTDTVYYLNLPCQRCGKRRDAHKRVSWQQGAPVHVASAIICPDSDLSEGALPADYFLPLLEEIEYRAQDA